MNENSTASQRDRIVVTGSLAHDFIMDFPGHFKDHILPDKLHVINISFLVEKLSKQRGGCGGNIAYTLALLGEKPRVVATAGSDFGEYQAVLADLGVDLSTVEIHSDLPTAAAFITTDRSDCQIQGFHVGAMTRAADLSLAERYGNDAAFCIVAPDDPAAIQRHCQEAREHEIAFFFDPSFQVTAMDGEALANAARGAQAMFLNDYEQAVFEEKTGYSGERLFELVQLVVVTLGAKGSEVRQPDGTVVEIPPATIEEIVDPTGAGDAYRGGFLAGWRRGYDLGSCGRMGSVASAYAVENYGPQGHHYDLEAFLDRYIENFGAPPS